MKKLLLNIVFGVIITILAMSLSTSILGIVFVNYGYIDLMIEELFTNVETKILMISLGGIAIGICNYLTEKYEKRYLLTFACSIATLTVVICLLTITSYTIVFKIAYIPILCLIMAILDFTQYISSKKDIDAINQKLKENKREEK